jgi:hypothetical protein
VVALPESLPVAVASVAVLVMAEAAFELVVGVVVAAAAAVVGSAFDFVLVVETFVVVLDWAVVPVIEPGLAVPGGIGGAVVVVAAAVVVAGIGAVGTGYVRDVVVSDVVDDWRKETQRTKEVHRGNVLRQPPCYFCLP